MSELRIGESVGHYTEMDIPGYYHRVTGLHGPGVVSCDFYPTAKLAGEVLVGIDIVEAEWAYLNLRLP